MVYTVSKLILWALIRPFIKRIDGIEHLPDKPFILAANHQSYIDGLLLLLLVARRKNKQLCFFVTNEKFLGPVWNLIFNHYGCIRVNGSVKKGLYALKQKKCLGIFPEGSRTYTGRVQPVTHSGLGVLALHSKAPVVPIAMHSYSFWNRYERIPHFRRNITVIIGKPLHFSGKPTPTRVRKTITTIWTEVKRLARIPYD